MTREYRPASREERKYVKEILLTKNWNCGGSHCQETRKDEKEIFSEVRVLATSHDSNAILCKACFNHEIAWRKQENKTRPVYARFEILTWESLEVYST